MNLKLFTRAAVAIALAISSAPASAEIRSGKPVIDNSPLGGSISCLIRYHGLRSRKLLDPNWTGDVETRMFVDYLETGEAGQHGAALPLLIQPDAPYSGYLRLKPFEFVEPDFGLKFSVTASGNAFIKKDARDAVGELTLTISDLATGNPLSTSDFPIEMFFSGGYSIPHVTISLPTEIVAKQKTNLTWDKDLLTQVRFQCN